MSRWQLGRARAGWAGGLVVGLGLAGLIASGQPPMAGQGPASAPGAGTVTRLLSAARGTHPLMCELASRVLDGGYGWHGAGPERPGLPLAAEDRAELRRLVRERGEPLDVAPLRAGLRDSDGCIRQVSALLLGRSRLAESRTELQTALRDPRAEVRLAGVVGLAADEADSNVPALVPLLRDADVEVRVGAAWALGRIESRAAVPPLLDLLGDGEPRLRAAAAWALGEIEDPAAVPRLTPLLRDPSAEVRLAAAWALGSIE